MSAAIDARSGFHQWAGSYDAPMTDIIKVQEDVARSIATNLEIRLATLAAEGFAARGSSSLQAYQLYLTAHYRYELATRTTMSAQSSCSGRPSRPMATSLPPILAWRARIITRSRSATAPSRT